MSEIKPLLFLTIFLCLLSAPTRTHAFISHNILILNSYHKGFSWTDNQVSAAQNVLHDKLPNAEILVEYMDTKRLYNEEYLQALFCLYELKYKNVHLDAVITTDDNALWFALKHRQALFKGVPIAFCGINDYKKSLIEGQPKVTGVVEVLDIGPTLDLALQLHPGTRKVVAIVDNTPTGVGQLNDIKKAAEHYPGLDFEYLEGKNLSHQELLGRLESLEKGTIVLLAVWLRDKNNKFIPVSMGGPQITSHSNAPVYGIIDMYFGYGIVGGKLLNSDMHGRIAAEKAVRLIDSETKAALPVIRTSTNPYMFDYEQLEKWSIDASDLPQDSIIINRPFSFYQRYKGLIYTALGIIALLVLVVAVLSVNIRIRVAAEAELKKSEEIFRKIFQNHTAIKLLIDPEDGRIVEANHAAEKFYGWPLAVLNSMSIQDINTLSLAGIKEEMSKAQDANQVKFNFQHRLADGSVRDVEVFTGKVEIKGKTLLHSIIHDVTERQVMENALRESEDKFRNIFDLSPQAVAVTDIETGQLQDVNNKLCELSKWDKKDLLGKTTTELGFYAPEDRFRFVGELNKSGIVNGMEMEFKDKDGGKLVTLMFARLITIAGRPLILTIFFDITGQREIEERLLIAQKNESIGGLAGGIAHDFNNILFPIVGLSEILVEDLPPGSPEQDSALEIFNAAMRGREVVKQILTFSRQSEPEKLLVRLQRTIQEAIKLGRSTIPTYIEIESEIDPDCGTVLANPTQIHQVVINLITNAFHAIDPDPGKISLGLAETTVTEDDYSVQQLQPGRYAKLAVSDTGKGISPADRDKIFEPYFTTKEQGKGTGLGLAVVYGIVKDHLGDIRVYSEPGVGTVFSVYLPLTEKTEPEELVAGTEDRLTGTESILLVDDEESIVRLEKRMLERLGYKVTSRNGSNEALETFRADPAGFDLVISDMNMPNMTGDYFARQIKIIREDIPVIICTGFSARINLENAGEAGIKGFLMKPIVKMEMAKMVRKTLDEARETKPD